MSHLYWTDEEFQAAAQRLDQLVQEFENLPFPEFQAKAREMLQAVDALHREGLGRLIRFIHEQGQAELVLRAAHDPVVHTLPLLYDFIPGDERAQVETALESVRPYLHSHGGAVEVLAVTDGVVHLKLSGACVGCAGSAMTLKRGIEAALREGYTGFRGMQVHEAPPVAPNGFVPLNELLNPLAASEVSHRSVRRPIFKAIAGVEVVPPGCMKNFEVEGVAVLVANVGGEFYAVRNVCPGSVAPLHLGKFTPPVIICPWHHEPFDIRTGRRADGTTGPGLAVLPIALVEGVIELAVNTLSEAVPSSGVPLSRA